jgi:ribosomal protein S18 acetylase RimI-like enzyme
LAGEEGICLIALAGPEVAGYLVGSLTENAHPSIQYAALETIKVVPEYRRQGVGSALVEDFRGWAREAGATRLSVDVAPRNAAAIGFYEAHGFIPATLVLERRID